MDYQENLSKIFEAVRQNNDFYLVTHVFPDGDALGSITALYRFLTNLGKNACMQINSEIPYQYEFLPHIQKIKRGAVPQAGKEYVFFFLDCAELKRARFDLAPFQESVGTLINIDHHVNNPGFGDINLVDHKKSAVSEMLFDLMHQFDAKSIDADVAISLYTGILTDTGKFQYSNTTREVHRTVGVLLDFDINPSKIFSHIYEREPRNRFKLLEAALRRVRIVDSKSLVYSYVLLKDFQRLRLPYSANDGIIEILRSVGDIDIAALYKQVGKDHYKVSLRSSNNGIDVSRIAQAFGGGGHKKAAAYSCRGRLKKNIRELMKEIERQAPDHEDN